MLHNNLRGIYYIILKDMKTYYLKPPAVSWGIVFPIAWILAFYLRHPGSFNELVPGLIAMTILFSTTAAVAVVINFELRLGSLERLLLAPLSLSAVLLGKVLGGAVFGFLMTAIITLGTIIIFGLSPNYFILIPTILLSLFVYASLGAMLCVMVKEVFEAQTLLNLPRFLMIFTSGVVFPVKAMPGFLQVIARFMPLTYTVDGLRASFSECTTTPLLNIFVLAVFSAIFITLGYRFLRTKFE